MKDTIWSGKDVTVFRLEELPVSRKKTHALYRLLSNRQLFNIVVYQELLGRRKSHFHFHPVPEILILISGKAFYVETDKGKKRVLPQSAVYIPRDVIHCVRNDSRDKSYALILIGKGYKDEDVVHVERRGNEWVEI